MKIITYNHPIYHLYYNFSVFCLIPYLKYGASEEILRPLLIHFF
jgi:hypothetical protein